MKNKIGMRLFGEVPLEIYAKTLQNLHTLITELTKQIEPGTKIEWSIDELEVGSAFTAVKGYYFEMEKVEKVVIGFENTGIALSKNQPIPYNQKVTNAANQLVKVINGKVSSIDFITTPDFFVEVYKSPDLESEKGKSLGYGTITGRVETLSSRQTLRFILYDSLFDRAIKCVVDEDKKELLKEIWDKDVTVTGLIRRDVITGRPNEIRNIEDIKILTEKPQGNFLKARGIIPWKEGTEKAENIIRRLRDEE